MVSLTMEEKQLDFNRPLLSVRRPTQASESESKPRSSDPPTNNIPPPSASPPVYKSDVKSGPVRNPGTVPFQWEHKPGKPKDETKPGLQSFAEPRYVPKLPLGRVREREVSVRKPETRVEDAKRSCDDTYLDAADTLSRPESFFYNCSNVSGHGGTLVEPFGTLSSDRQTQDLMMGRFLPAAKALTSETAPPHLARKSPKPEDPVKEKQNRDGRMRAQRAVSVRRMRSKYQDSNESQNKVTVNEDERKLKLNESVAQGGSVAVESSCTSRTKVSRNFGELLASDDNAWKPPSESPVAEKTLYVDTVHSVDKNVQEETKEKSSRDDVVPVKEDVQNLVGPDEEAISQPKTTVNSVMRDEDFTEECPDQANVAAEVTKEKIDLEAKFQRNTRNHESSRLHHRSTYHIVPPPPLPKAPSDSWLKRTLPTIPPKNNSFTWLQSLGDDNNKINQASPKWETMVKTSNTQQGFVCFSKETLNPIPEA